MSEDQPGDRRTQGAGGSGGDGALEEVLAQYLMASDAGEAPDRERFIATHPELTDALRAFFADESKVRAMATVAGAGVIGSAIDDVSADAPQVHSFGDYELIEEIGRGGMGVVYRARQVHLNRVVALKMILAGVFASAEDVKRFYVEAHNAADLDHPNIVPVYDVGRHRGGQHYFSMKLIDGESLAATAGRFSDDPQRAARLLATVARAVHHAHQRGILHRDLKPGNILIDTEGRPHVTDFGLAHRMTDGARGDGLTVSGAVLGSPRYMPPEQARGEKGLTVAADVYSLGAILYELLTGRPPFSGATVIETLRLVREQEPTRPSLVLRGVDRDLETVTLKCLEKDPRRRYASAEALAEELERWLNGEPIRSRPVGTTERFWRWCRRKPALAGAAGVALLATAATIVVLAVAVSLVGRSRDENRTLAISEGVERRRADQNARQAEANARDAEQRMAVGLVEAGDSQLKSGRAADARRSYAQARDIALKLGAMDVPAIAGLLQTYKVSPPPLLGGGDGEHPPAAFRHDKPVRGLALAADGRRALAASGDTLWLWDVPTARLIRRYACPTPGSILTCVAISTDGKRGLSGSDEGGMYHWDLDSGASRPFEGHTAAVTGVVFHPAGKTALSSDAGGACRVWDLETGQQTAVVQTDSAAGPDGRGYPLAVTSDGTRAAIGVSDKWLAYWNVATGDIVRRLPSPAPLRSEILSVSFSPDGKLALAGSEDNSLRLWNVSNGRLLRTFHGHEGPVRAVAFLPDGVTALSAAEDGTLRLWHPSTEMPLGTFTGRAGTDAIEALALSQDGRTALAASRDGGLTLWHLGAGDGAQDDGAFVGAATGPAVRCAVYSPDGRLVLSTHDGQEPSLRLWDVATRRHLRGYESGGATVAAFSEDGASALVGRRDGAVWHFDPLTGLTVHVLVGHSGPVTALASCPGGARAISGGADGSLILWDLEKGTPVLRFPGHGGAAVRGLAVSPDGSMAATAGGADRTARIWDLATGQETAVLQGHENAVNSVAFSEEGTSLLSGSADGTVLLWHVKSAEKIATLRGHSHEVTGVAFSPDGRMIASSALDASVRLWDANGREELSTLSGHAGGLLGVTFSRDSRSILVSGRNGTVRHWDLDRPTRFRELEAGAARATDMLRQRPDDPVALRVLGQWYAFRGIDGWAVDLLEQAQRGGADVSSLALARSHWGAGQAAAAELAFRAAGERGEAPSYYIAACIEAMRNPLPSPAPGGLPPTATVRTDAFDLAVLYEGLERLDLAIAQYGVATRLRPTAPEAFAARALLHYRHNRFTDALADYRRVMEIDPAQHWPWVWGACLLAYNGDAAGYDAHCEALLLRFGKTTDPNIAERTARACLMLPRPDQDLRRQVELLDRALATGDHNDFHWFQMARGMAEYRAGRYEAAVEWLVKAQKSMDENGGWVTTDLFLAMSHHRLGRPTESEAAMRRAAERMKKTMVEPGTRVLTSTMIDQWLLCQTARREAEALFRAGAALPRQP